MGLIQEIIFSPVDLDFKKICVRTLGLTEVERHLVSYFPRSLASFKYDNVQELA